MLDHDGKPITDLQQQDFRIIEDKVPQDIGHFERRSFTPETPAAGPMRRTTSLDLAPQHERIFLIVLGRGRLQVPTASLDALLHFIRAQLLPQDQVAVLAYNHATPFSSDHEAAALTVERFKRQNDAIETDLDAYFGGLRAAYGSRVIPGNIQAKIDTVFPEEGRNGALSTSGRDLADALGLRFNEYVAQTARTGSDLDNIASGIEYLRHFAGEKHLVFVTEDGIFLPRLENDRSIAALANAAQVVVDNIQTGGVRPNRGFSQTFRINTLRTISELTGGQTMAFEEGGVFFDHLDRTTRFSYLLGFYPSNANWDGRYRHVTVSVNRPGATVLYRHGYYAERTIDTGDRRRTVTNRRIGDAARRAEDVHDLKVTLNGSEVKGDGGAREATVHVVVDAARVSFATTDDEHVAELDAAFFVSDAGRKATGDSSQKIVLNLSQKDYDLVMRSGIAFTARIPVTGDPRFVKVVVYDYFADIVGSATTTLK